MRNPRVVRRRTLTVHADVAWEYLADLSQHGHLVPLTKMRAPARITARGDRIVARSAGFFVDRMVTESVEARGSDPDDLGWVRLATLRKEGPVLHGFAGIAVRSEGPARCTVLWAEDVCIPVLAAAAPVVNPVLDLVFRIMGDIALARLGTRLGR